MKQGGPRKSYDHPITRLESLVRKLLMFGGSVTVGTGLIWLVRSLVGH